jgi:four helix bundle protein
MTNDDPAASKAPYDIRARTFEFAARIVRLFKSLPRELPEVEIGRQLARSGMSIGANVEEADAGESRRDFVHKMSIACKEGRETRYWLRLLSVTVPDSEEIPILLRQSDELVRILSTIVRNAKNSG